MCKHERVLIELKRHLTKFVPGEDHYAKDKILKALVFIETKVADEMQFEAQKEKAVDAMSSEALKGDENDGHKIVQT